MNLRVLCSLCGLAIVVAAVAAIRSMAGPALWIVAGACVVALLSLVLIYRNIARPISAVTIGVDLLRAQDFGSRLAPVGEKNADRIAATFNEMMGRLRDERLRVLEQNRFLGTLIDASPTGIVIFNLNGTIRSANPAARRMLCLPDNPEGADLLARPSALAAKISGLGRGETCVVRLSDTSVWRASRLTFLELGFQREFLMIETLTEEVRRAEKNAYGKVIRLMAHEVNNTVGGVVSFLEMLEVDGLEGVRERLLGLSTFISGYAEMVKLPAPDCRPMDLNALLRSMLPFLESLAAGRDIAVSMELCGGELSLKADAVQLEQVVVNVVKNAVESIGSHGHVTVATSPQMLEIIDDGPGITPEAARSLFSPFFSTKPGGQGIGLMFVREVLTNHGYYFNLATGPDGLTRFTVRLPQS